MNAAQYDWINDYVGTPYRLGGRGRDGCDCWGLMLLVWRDQRGIELPDFQAPNDRDIVAAIEAVGANYERWPDVAPVAQVELGRDWDMVACFRHGRPLHMGLVINAGILHAAQIKGGAVFEAEARFNRFYPNRVYWRWLA